MKKALIILTLSVLILSLSACGHEHVWTPADCTTPATCTECGETEGEALGHSFAEADCTSPKTCTACSLTEGEALGHTLAEATFQSAPTCTVCSEAFGEPLTPDFVTYGISADMEIGKSYDYVTTTPDEAQTVIGTVSIADYEVIDTDGGERTEREGYKWHNVTFVTEMSDPTAIYNGFLVDYCVSDYYDIKKFKDMADHSSPIMSKYTVSYNGVDTDVYMGQSGDFVRNDDGSVTFTLKISVHKPIGYDGIVIGMNNGSIDARLENYINDVYSPVNFNLFRIPA